MRATFPVGVATGWARVLTAFVVVVTLLWAGTEIPATAGRWIALGLSVIAVLVLLVAWRGVPLGGLVVRALRRRDVAPGPAGAEDHRLRYTDTHVGLRAVGDELIAVLAVDGPAHVPSVFDQHRVQSAASLPIDVIADAVRQFDVTLAGIDVLSVGRRRAGRAHHHYGATYSRMVGDHPAIGQRRTWCVLRMNRLDSVAAVVCRDSVAATLATCAARLAAELTARHLPARVLDAAALAEVDAALSAGLGPNPRPRWSAVRHDGGSLATYWVSPRDISSDTLDRIWVPDTDSTATAVQLRPAVDGAVSVGVLVRYGASTEFGEPPVTGLNPLSGRQDLGVAAISIAAPAAALDAPHRVLTDGEDLRAPLGATGILLGALPSGHPLLMNLAAPGPRSSAAVTVAGELALLIQVALRTAAIGYQVLVVSRRPQRWRDATATGLRVLDGVPAELPDDGRGVAVFYDLLDAPPGPAAAISVRLVAPGSASVADVHLEQESASSAVIRTAEFTHRVIIDVEPERNVSSPRRAA
ncbi:type VII secretion protein EccE [Mycobacterium sp. BK086]|uniref:type VII secretion protein EccE n=1 Tax=Mycobacterium sp. BK086 TaxID=2512165 RepID=UPI00106129BB|nr:type VII secretion protein EccE [Mycobacterium sp. BK086]TDO06490.1 type VII secretion protein EccE [Mycobacterium sp. BK086]